MKVWEQYKYIEDRIDNSGLRFYLGAQRRTYDLGYLTFGTFASAVAISIPPRANNFAIDAFCPAIATAVGSFRYTVVKNLDLTLTYLENSIIWHKYRSSISTHSSTRSVLKWNFNRMENNIFSRSQHLDKSYTEWESNSIFIQCWILRFQLSIW